MRNKIFQYVASRMPGRSMFDLSYEKKFDGDLGLLYPIMCDEAVPGDIWKIGNQIVLRFMPLVAPILHEINLYVHYFFVPYRILWDDWESFITGGLDGNDSSTVPRWTPTDTTKGGLWDLLGLPVGVNPTGALPLDFPRRAYNTIFNEYYRDELVNGEAALTNEDLLTRKWEKDYFTSARLAQQLGTAPALSISGSTSAVFPNWTQNGSSLTYQYDSAGPGNPWNIGTETALNNNTVDLSNATTFDIAELRLTVQIQRWLERNSRAGARYTEFLKSHFGVSPIDERLDRPEYIGGSKSPVIISEVLQTSQSDAALEAAGVPTPQGNLAGHGLAVNSGYVGSYRVTEFGLVMGIMSVMPRAVYNSQGVNRQWLRESKYDFFFPEFANLSEQAIIRAELYADTSSANNNTIFGYQGRYDEMRVKQDMVCNNMRDTFDYWHISRQFSAAPLLNSGFINCDPRKDWLAADTESAFVVSVGNVIKAIRPLPVTAEPGLMDH